MPDFLEKHGSIVAILGLGIAGFAALIVIMGQHFDAQQQINSQFFQLVMQRLDAQDERMNERFEQVNQRFEQIDQRFEQIDQRFEQVNQRFDRIDQRLDRLTDAVAELYRLMASVSERVARNEGEIDVIREHLRIADTPAP